MPLLKCCSYGILLALASLACAEFPNAPAKPITVTPGSGWPSEWFVRDTHTLVINVTLGDSTAIAGIQAQWSSGNPAVLDVVPAVPPPGSKRIDTLMAYLRATATAHARGQALIEVTLATNGAFQRTQFRQMVTVSERWLAVSAGASHSCAIAADSTAYCWGQGAFGALGSGIPGAALLPVPVTTLGDLRFRQISAGEDNTCGVIVQRAAFCWGSDLDARLGNADPSFRNQFTPVPVAGGTSFQIVVANSASCGIASAGLGAYCWGDDNLYQLGFEPQPNDTLDWCGTKQCSLTPRPVSFTPNSWLGLDVGGTHTCALATGPAPGKAYCWGKASRGGLGAGPTKLSSLTPTDVLGGLLFRTISTGEEHTCAIVSTSDSAAYCWGNNNHGQLGNGTLADTSLPVRVSGGYAFASITGGGQHTCGRTASGSAYCWGQGLTGQLGNEGTGDKPTPFPVSGGLTFTSLTAGDAHTCGTTDTGAIYCWGSGALGRLGVGSPTTDLLVPARIAEPLR